MNALFWLIFLMATFTPQSSTTYRDSCNFVGFSIAGMGLTARYGFPEMYRETNQGQYLIMSGLLAYLAYYTAKDEIKIIRDRKKGIYWK